MVGIISVVIGDHFGGGDHFDGGDHFGGGMVRTYFLLVNVENFNHVHCRIICNIL